MGRIFPLPDDNDRSVKEWAEDNGVEYVNTAPKVDIKWAKKHQVVKPKRQCDVQVNKTLISFSDKSMEKIGTNYVKAGSGEFNGSVALFIRPSKKGASNTFKVGVNRGLHRLTAPNLLKQLFESGLTIGRYKLSEKRTTKGDIIAVKEDKQ